MRKFTILSFALLLVWSNFSSKAQCLPATVPYLEGFSGLTANNQLPACWSASNLGTNCLTFSSNGIAAFDYSPSISSYFYSAPIMLSTGINYSVSMFYNNSSYSTPTWSVVSLLLGTSQSTIGLTNLVSNWVVASQGYLPISTMFSVNASGIYYIVMKGDPRLSIGCCDPLLRLDDLSITIPCCCNSPTVTIGTSTNVVCQGEQALLSGFGADTYTWSNGVMNSSITVNPFMNTTYQVIGTNAMSGCTASAAVQIQVNPKPNVLLTSPFNTVCTGTNLQLMAFGANSYSWSTGITGTNAINASTSSSSTYSVVGANNYGCKDSSYIHITVLPKPQLYVATSQDSICAGQNVNLMALGAQSYTWTNGTSSFIGGTVQVSPPVTTVYTVTGTDSLGCTNSLALVQTVVNCVFEPENRLKSDICLFPNPFKDRLYVELAIAETIRINLYDASGKLLIEKVSNSKNTTLNTETLSQGYYHVKIQWQNQILNYKLIKN